MSETMLPPEREAKLMAAVDLVRRTGARQIQMRYSDDEQPVVWMAVAIYDETRFDVAGAPEPVTAALRLVEQLVDGARCTHCKRPTGVTADELGTMPLDDLVCWYQYDPELQTFRRGCEGDVE